MVTQEAIQPLDPTSPELAEVAAEVTAVVEEEEREPCLKVRQQIYSQEMATMQHTAVLLVVEITTALVGVVPMGALVVVVEAVRVSMLVEAVNTAVAVVLAVAMRLVLLDRCLEVVEEPAVVEAPPPVALVVQVVALSMFSKP
jgi:hypothetical protein